MAPKVPWVRLRSSQAESAGRIATEYSRGTVLNRFRSSGTCDRCVERLKPVAVFPKIDLEGQFLSYDKIDDEISKYRLSLFNPSRFVREEYRPEYERKFGNFTQAQREDFLIGMMKVNFLKPLESSVYSFQVTMRRTIDKIEELEKRIVQFKEIMEETPEFGFDFVSREALDDPELEGALEVGKKLKFRLAHLDLDEWAKELARDKAQLKFLHDKAETVTADRDAKLAELKSLIRDKVQHPTRNKENESNRKVIVFTAFADTATYLYDALADWAKTELGIHVALVTGTGQNRTSLGRSDYNHILTNFSPRAKSRAKITGMPQDEGIDLLIATDCISEGQNLQDCDYLVNYDIHWNPVRIIQRFGRIDRIGSRNPAVQLVNFWPTPHLDKYIRLKHRVEARMALADLAATFEDNLLETEELEDIIADDLKYRDRQLLRLKDEILSSRTQQTTRAWSTPCNLISWSTSATTAMCALRLLSPSRSSRSTGSFASATQRPANSSVRCSISRRITEVRWTCTRRSWPRP